MNGKIGLLDSGLGGLSVLKELMSLLPEENYLFYEDSIHNPYGEKSEEELFKITSSIVDYLLEHDCKIIVLACNTATTCCIDFLRKKYPNVIFVGTVPAIKVAYDYHYHSTLILSTPYTTKSKRVQELINDYKNDDQEILNISGENLANLIELNKMEEVRSLLLRILKPYQDRIDSLVLGCTHYSLIKEEIQKILPNVHLLDGCIGVSQEVKRQLLMHDLLIPSHTKGSLTIVNSKDSSLVERSYDLLRQ